MKTYLNKAFIVLLALLTFSACEVEEFGDLNNAEVSGFEGNLTRGDLSDLVSGILYSSRVRLGTYFDDVGVVGREFWRFSSSDPRFTQDLLGGGNSVLDNNTFYITGPWAARYRTVGNGNIILDLLSNEGSLALFNSEEIEATRGLVKTFIAYELLLNLNLTYENGIRTDVDDPNNLGPFQSLQESLTSIRAILDDAATNLQNGGSEFPVPLTSGFENFSTPSTFLQVNRALTARVAAYQGDYAAVRDALDDSFMNEDPSTFENGLYHVFSEDALDLINPVFFAPNSTSAGVRVAHPSFVDDAEANDNRLDDVFEREETISFAGLSGDFDFFRYKSRTAPIPIIRNEELLLLYAEAQINNMPSETVRVLNIIRAAAGVGPYPGDPSDANDLTEDMLRQRRYSLYGEGHRWIDGRRFNLLDDETEFPIDRVDEEGNPDNVWTNFPIPLAENAG